MGSKNNSSRNFLVQGSILAFSSILVRLIGILYRIPLTNIVGKDGMGIYSIAFEIYNIGLILSSYSMPLAVSKLVAARVEKKEYKNSFRVFTLAMVFAVVAGLIMSSIIFFGADFIANTFYKDNMGVVIPLRVLAPTILIFSILGTLRGYFQGKRTMMPTAFSQVLEQIVNAFVSVGAAWLFMKNHNLSDQMEAYGAAGGTLGTTLGALSGLLFLVFVYLAYRPVIKKQIRRDKTEKIESAGEIFKLLLMTILPVIISQTIYQISGLLDSVIFHNILGNLGVALGDRNSLYGIYSAQYKTLTNLPISIASALATSMIPTIVASVVSNDLKGTKRKIHDVIKFNMLIAIPAAVGMSVLGTPIMKLLFSPPYDIAGKTLEIGGIAIIFFSLSTVTNAVLQGINKMRIPVIHSAISLAIHVVLLYILLAVFKMDIYGLIIGNITFPLVVCILNWISIKRYLHYKQEVVKTFLIPTISSLIMGVCTFAMYKLTYAVIKSNAISTILSIVVAMFVYFICMLVLKGITEEELSHIPKGRTLVKVLKRLHLM